MKKLITIINFKTYKQGKEAVELAKKIERVSKDIIVGVQAANIKNVSEKTKLKVFAEHVDYYLPGRNTGYITPESVKASGAKGTFLNHSEHKINFKTIKKTIERCKNIRLKTAVFAKSLKEISKIEKVKPDYLIYEPPSLVAGKVSVSSAKPKMIGDISKNVKMKFLVGAGIKNREDVEVAMKLGASGIAVSSAITKAKNPGEKLRELIG